MWCLLVQVKVVMNKAYVPKFNNAFEHFLLHTGGRAVIDEMEEKLSLTPAQCQPSKDALYRFGNTSAASTWCVPTFMCYELHRASPHVHHEPWTSGCNCSRCGPLVCASGC